MKNLLYLLILNLCFFKNIKALDPQEIYNQEVLKLTYLNDSNRVEGLQRFKDFLLSLDKFFLEKNKDEIIMVFLEQVELIEFNFKLNFYVKKLIQDFSLEVESSSSSSSGSDIYGISDLESVLSSSEE